MNNPMLKGASLTLLTLVGGLIVGLVAGDLTFNLLPGSSIDNPSVMHMTFAAVPALLGFLAGGWAWGIAMGGLTAVEDQTRMGWAGLLGFGPITIILAVGLGMAEPPLVAAFGRSAGIHRIFTFLFTPSAFLIAGISAFAIGRGLRDNALAIRLLWQVGLAAALTFLVVNLSMESAGWVVGAPRAGERATMLVVLFSGLLGATLVAGGWLGKQLSGWQNPSGPE
jgi:hypothetical protein